MKLRSYQVAEAATPYLTMDDAVIIAEALRRIELRLNARSAHLFSPQVAKDYLRLKLAGLEHEVFYVLFLDVKNRLIASEEMFRGSLTHTSVHAREIVKTALRHNAASVMFAHNHPSGVSDPSDADLRLTAMLKEALGLVDVKLLDHFVIVGDGVHSFAEHGQL